MGNIMKFRLGLGVLNKIFHLFKIFEKYIFKYFYTSNYELFKLKDTAKEETCLILGNGPSLKNVDNKLLDKYISFGSNGVFLKYIPTYYITISRDFYTNYVAEINNISCKYKFIEKSYNEIIDSNTISIKCSWPNYGKFFNYMFQVPLAYSLRPDKLIYLGGSVLFAQIQLAQWMGFKKIILLGVDHNMVSDDKRQYGGVSLSAEETKDIHFSKDYKSSMKSDIMATENAFRIAKYECEKAGIEIFNATPNTKLDVIKKLNLNLLNKDEY